MFQCGNCKHYRELPMKDRDGSEIILGYCHAIHTCPMRNREYPACKRYTTNPEAL